MKKLNIVIAAIAVSVCFVACEKEEVNPVNGSELALVKKEKVIINKSESLFFQSIKDLEDYVNKLEPETSVKIKEDSGVFEVVSIPFNNDEIINPEEPESVWPIPSHWDDAWDEVSDFLSTGCWVDITIGYGMMAVNLSC